MSVKKTLFTVLLLAGSACLGDVEYMYWQVDQSSLDEPVQFKYAQLGVWELGEGGKYTRVTFQVDTETYNAYLGGKDDPYNYDHTELADDSGLTLAGGRATAGIAEQWKGAAYSFQLELFNDNWELVGTGLLVSYESLAGARFEGSGSAGAMQTWNAVGPAPIPEPTSGMMVLVGMAMLALRRKRWLT